MAFENNNSSGMWITQIDNNANKQTIVNKNNNIDPGKRFNKKKGSNSITINNTTNSIPSAVSNQLRKKFGDG